MYILGFDEITKNDVARAGGKGANLGEMTGCGIPVPRGFVICADGYRHFIQENGLDEKFASLLAGAGDSEDKLIPAASAMRELILNSALPADLKEEIKAACEKLQTQQTTRADLRLAIRSSATAEDLPDDSFAGQHPTWHFSWKRCPMPTAPSTMIL